MRHNELYVYIWKMCKTHLVTWVFANGSSFFFLFSLWCHHTFVTIFDLSWHIQYTGKRYDIHIQYNTHTYYMYSIVWIEFLKKLLGWMHKGENDDARQHLRWPWYMCFEYCERNIRYISLSSPLLRSLRFFLQLGKLHHGPISASERGKYRFIWSFVLSFWIFHGNDKAP